MSEWITAKQFCTYDLLEIDHELIIFESKLSYLLGKGKVVHEIEGQAKRCYGELLQKLISYSFCAGKTKKL